MSAPAPSSSSPSYQTLSLSHIHRVTLSPKSPNEQFPFFPSPKNSASSSLLPSFSRLKSRLSVLFLSDSLSLSLSFSLTFSPLARSSILFHKHSPFITLRTPPPQLNRLDISHALAFPRSHVYKPTENHTGCHAIRRFQSIMD